MINPNMTLWLVTGPKNMPCANNFCNNKKKYLKEKKKRG